ncbi:MULTISPECIES: hypothetical protein [unclassified Photobacterium]|uniref:hypothetical protein n=1 Tax=unclassified Photobacterium TaxID=2628852 RepID=UPI001B8D73AA|nr:MULTISPECIES: hypothetical protein [unclassified Photobacterium]MDO6704969.1 hypothetical protein [Photobacterium sp. 1_MG-2023]QUJ66484.1 hypothetical protein KDD30_09915 [Photobacterium sp. GJ3]
MAFMDFVSALLFSLGVLAVGLAGGCIFSLLTVREDEVESVAEKRIEYGVFASACVVIAGLILYALT